jgi:hypothetical protein
MNDQPAFPCQYQGDTRSDAFGLTMRDYFAAKAMQTMLESVYDYEAIEETHKARSRLMARDAYATADAMMNAREAKPCS